MKHIKAVGRAWPNVRRWLAVGLAGAAGVASWGARAQEWSASAYGTLGYAVSDRPYRYLRFIDDQGTFRRDSVLGAQVDLRFNPQWAATVQGKVAPSAGNDNKWGVNTAWAFLSWRPDNDWLLRAGKQRLPLYLNSESVDVGQTYAFARLPAHFYDLMPNNDFNGLYASRTWAVGASEASLDLYGGQSTMTVRGASRLNGVEFLSGRTRELGLALALHKADSTWRVGAHKLVIRKNDGSDMGAHFPYVDLGGGQGYYKLMDSMTGPDIGRVSHKTIHFYTLGTEQPLAPGWTLTSELVRSVSPGHADFNWNTISGYVTVSHDMGRFTPYATLSRLKSLGAMARLSAGLDAVNLPPDLYGPTMVAVVNGVNAVQQAGADLTAAYDERAWAVGTSLSVTPQSRLKFEWMRTEIGKRSGFVDSPPSGVVRHQHINVLSASYSFVY